MEWKLDFLHFDFERFHGKVCIFSRYYYISPNNVRMFVPYTFLYYSFFNCSDSLLISRRTGRMYVICKGNLKKSCVLVQWSVKTMTDACIHLTRLAILVMWIHNCNFIKRIDKRTLYFYGAPECQFKRLNSSMHFQRNIQRTVLPKY